MVIYGVVIGDILHARLKMVQDVAGPIPEARLPEESETTVPAPRDQRAGA